MKAKIRIYNCCGCDEEGELCVLKIKAIMKPYECPLKSPHVKWKRAK